MADRNRDQQRTHDRERDRNRFNQGNYNDQYLGRSSNYSGAGYRDDAEDDYLQDVGREHYDQQGHRGAFITGADRTGYGRADDDGSGYGTSGGFRNRDRGSIGGGGSHRGKGPRGYQRSQKRILEDVCERLTDDGMIDASHVEVQVQNNEVVLSGMVHNREEKRRAEDLAEAVAGVRNVENRLKVEPGSENDTNYYREYDEEGRIR